MPNGTGSDKRYQETAAIGDVMQMVREHEACCPMRPVSANLHNGIVALTESTDMRFNKLDSTLKQQHAEFQASCVTHTKDIGEIHAELARGTVKMDNLDRLACNIDEKQTYTSRSMKSFFITIIVLLTGILFTILGAAIKYGLNL